MAEATTSRELVRIIAAEFDLRGWSDENELALAIATQADREQALDPAAAVGLASDSFLAVNGIDADALRAALQALFSGRTFADTDGSGPTFIDQSITIGDNNTISGNINAGGNQLTLTNNTPPDELLSAFSGFVGTAASQGFSPHELQLLDRLAAALDDLDADQLESAARKGIEDAELEPARLAKFRDAVMTSTASGVAVQAIIAAAGAVL